MSQPPQDPPPDNPLPGQPGDGSQQPGHQPPGPQGPGGGSKTGLVVVLVVLAVLIVGGAAGFVLAQDDEDEGGDGGRAATGGGRASGEEQAFVDAITEANETSTAGMTTDQARCIAEATVSAVGVDVLQAAATPDEIRAEPDASLADLGVEADQAQVDELAEGASGCFDPVQFTLDSLEREGFPQEVVGCVEENLSEELAASYMAAYYIGSPDVREASNSEFQDAVGSCRDLANE